MSVIFDTCALPLIPHFVQSPVSGSVTRHTGALSVTVPSETEMPTLKVPPYLVDCPETRTELTKYYAEITNFDVLVGMIRGSLEKKGLWEKTIFVVCSEQGVQFPFAKWTCYDNGLHTGMVMSWPGVIEAGSQADALVSMADIAPTFVDAAGDSDRAAA